MKSRFQDTDLRALLNAELRKRQKSNPRYSVRAFARDLQIGVSSLSEVLTGKRALSRSNILKVSDALSLKPGVVNALLSAFDYRTDPDADRHEFHSVYDDELSIIGQWYYLAIMNLAKLPEAPADPDLIAARLGIESGLVRVALQRLTKLGFIRIKGSTILRTSKSITSPANTPSQVKRNFYRQHLALAERTLDGIGVEERYFSVVTVPADPRMLGKAREAIDDFRKKIARLLEKGHPDRVYSVGIQLYPISEVRRSSDKSL